MANMNGKEPNEWTRITVNEKSYLSVSNSSVPVPSGLHVQCDFVNPEEQERILQEWQDGECVWEGFDQRRRVQRYRLEDDEVPDCLVKLHKRLRQATGLIATHVALEEYDVSKWTRTGEYASNHVVTTFESLCFCNCQSDNCSCFVAQIPLNKEAVQHINKPAQRQANCWRLESNNHYTDIKMEQGSLVIKKDYCLWNWRSRLTASPENTDKVVLVKFYRLPDERTQSTSDDSDTFGYIPSENDQIPKGPMPPLQDLLTIIVTTSPIKSNPSTELLEKTLETFVNAGEAVAYQCPKIIVCDGYRKQEDNGEVTKRHSNEKQALRNGIVNDDQAENYRLFKQALRKLCESASERSFFVNTRVVELEERHGYGYALRHALRHCVSTPFVCVVQHDRTFMRPTPVEETISSMWQHPYIKYVGMSMRSNLMYRDIFLGKYGKAHLDELNDLVLRVPELLVDSSQYGPDSESTRQMICRSDRIRENIRSYAQTYRGSAQYAGQQEWLSQNPVAPGKHQMTLTPTLFWYDNVHICETAHYRDFIFHPSYKMVARGGFVEDKCSPVLKRTVERLGLKEGHSRFGCYLLDDHSGMFFTGHLDGGSYFTKDDKDKLQQNATTK